MVVYAVVRGSQVIALYRTEGSAKDRVAHVNDLFKRGRRAVVVPMPVLM